MKIKMILYVLAILIVAFPFNAFGDGACCDSTNGSCSIQYNQGDCSEGAGIWQGDDTVCDPNPCQQEPSAIPTLNEWGMIIFTVLAGLGAIYYMRRQKTAKS
jgi:hypothetical protein